MKKTYWFADEAEKVVEKMAEYHGTWTIWGSNPICQAWVRNSIAYYSHVLDPAAWDSALVYDGEQGELIRMAIPQARSLIRQLVTLITKQRLSFNAIAESKGADVVQETRLGNALSAQIVEHQQLDRKGENLVEQALVYGMSFTYTKWRTDLGKPYSVGPDGVLVYEGDLEISTPSVFDVFFDYSVPDWKNNEWVEVRVVKSRWSLVAQFPHLEDEILSLPTIKDWRGPHASQYRTLAEDDFVYCYELYHRKTPAIPKGRMIMYASDKCIFHDGDNEYEDIPVEPMMPETILGMGLGCPQLSALLPAQEMLDHSFSAIATNQAAFAVQSVTVPRGAGIGVQDIGGMNFISFTPQNVPGGGKPEPLQLAQSSPETFKFIDVLLSNMQQLSNINSALRGAPPPGVTSGVAIATLTNNSIEFLTSASKSYAGCMERTMFHAINAYRKFAKIPHIVRMVGKNFQSFTKDFVGSDLDPIQAIKITLQNPLTQTLSGRSDIAEKLLQGGMIKTTQDYLSVLEGSPLNQLYETELSENDLVQSENEALLEGKQVISLATDDHAAHVRKHAGLLNDPVVRLQNARVQEILNHIEEHKNLAQNTDPFLTAMVRTGKQPEGGPPPQGAPGLSPSKPQQPGAAPLDEGMPTGPEHKSAQPAPDLVRR